MLSIHRLRYVVTTLVGGCVIAGLIARSTLSRSKEMNRLGGLAAGDGVDDDLHGHWLFYYQESCVHFIATGVQLGHVGFQTKDGKVTYTLDYSAKPGLEITLPICRSQLVVLLPSGEHQSFDVPADCLSALFTSITKGTVSGTQTASYADLLKTSPLLPEDVRKGISRFMARYRQPPQQHHSGAAGVL